MSSCCLTGYKWGGKPKGTESTLAKNNTYVTGDNKDVAILMIHDIFGWTLPNLRLTADHYAEEVGATVYLPDFFGGEVVSPEMLFDPEKRAKFDTRKFIGEKNSKDIRWPEISSCARALKEEHGFKKVGAVGFCYGGWAVFQLGAKDNALVDAISTAHPSLLTNEEVDAISVPVQIIAPEHDPMLTPELKAYCNNTIPSLNVPYDYQYFPGLTHGFAARANENDEKVKKGLERAKNCVSSWFAQWLRVN